MKKTQVAVGFVVFIAATLLPYVVAANAAGEEYFFVGFLLNPIDGASYLAKMQQGYAGSWTFTLPFTAEPGEGVFLFLFYIFLGHLVRLSGLGLLAVFHLIRVAAGAFMLWQGLTLARTLLPEGKLSGYAWILLAFGSGIGWLFVFSGDLTADFWVAEGYPFLSAYTNPHFPFGLGLMFWLFRQTLAPSGRWLVGRLLAAGILMSLVLPFGVIIVGVVVGALTLWESIEVKHIHLRPVWIAVVAGVPYGLYAYLVTLNHVVLAEWNRQNLTPAPPVWDILVSLSPGLLLALIGLWAVWARREQPAVRLLVLWLGLTFLLVYAPANLQRRFFLGLYAPVALLAVYGIEWLARRTGITRNALFFLALILSLPTNLIVLTGGMMAVGAHSPALYATKGEKEALAWMAEHTEEGSVFLALPETSLWIPAFANRKVLYGHPYESIPANELKRQVEGFYQGESGYRPFEPVDFVVYGPREQAWMGAPVPKCPVVYQNDGVTICAAK